MVEQMAEEIKTTRCEKAGVAVLLMWRGRFEKGEGIGCESKTSFFSKADGLLRQIFDIDEDNPSSSSSEEKSSAAAAVVIVDGGGEHGEGGR